MKYFLIAGEASGDMHASNLMRELKQADPEAEFCFLGGDMMAAQGGAPIVHYREMAFMGFTTVLRNGRKVLDNMERCKRAIREFMPDVVILIDYPSFNLRIAKFAKEKLLLPVYYYIPPKLWAWKEFRIRQIKKYVDKTFAILPFEPAFYKKHNYQVSYVGNPVCDSIAARPNKEQNITEFRLKNNLPDKPIIAVLPGSRRQEIESCLPTIIEAASYFTDSQIVISGAPGIPVDFYDNFIYGSNIRIVFNQTYELLSHAIAAVVNSGTATLETALIGTPQVVVYQLKFGRIALLLKDLVLKVKYVSLVNLIAGKEVISELLAYRFSVDNVRSELHKLLYDNLYRSNILSGYREVENLLGGPGAAANTAKKIVESLSSYKANF